MDQRPIKRGSDAVVTAYGNPSCEASTCPQLTKRQRQTGNETFYNSFDFNPYYPQPSIDFLGVGDLDLQPNLRDLFAFGDSVGINGRIELQIDPGIGAPHFPATFDFNLPDPSEMLVPEVHYEASTNDYEAELTFLPDSGYLPQVPDNSNALLEGIGSGGQAGSLLPLWAPTFTAMTSFTTTQASWGLSDEGYYRPSFPSPSFPLDEPVAGKGIVPEASPFRAGPSQSAVQRSNIAAPNMTTPLSGLAYPEIGFSSQPAVGGGQAGKCMGSSIRFSPPIIQSAPPKDNWIHSGVNSEAFRSVIHIKNADGTRATGSFGRKGPLELQQAREASALRIEGACFRCQSLKVKCSLEEPCGRCRGALSSSIARAVCKRLTLGGFVDILFPLASEYGKLALEQLTRENISTRCSNKIEAEVNYGPTYPVMTVTIEEFQPTNDEVLAQAHIAGDLEGTISPEFGITYAAPFALTDSARRALRDKCIENMEASIKGPRNYGELYWKETSIVPWDIFHAIDDYWRATEDPDVARALKLYATQYYMVQDVRLCEESAEKAEQSLANPRKLEYTFSLPSRVIIIQIKHEMYNLLREMAADLLQAIADIKSRQLSWASTCCAMLTLSMCVEMVQVDIDLQAVREIDKDKGKSRDASIQQCQDLDCTISLCIQAFHKGFKSHRKGGFNPIRDGLGAGTNHDAATVKLVDTIRNMIKKHDGEMEERIKAPSFDYQAGDLTDLLGSHLRFRDRNPGRLVSKVLRSFLRWKMD